MAPQINAQPKLATDPEYLQESNAANILALLGAFGFTALTVVVLRLYVRTKMLKSVGADDYTMLVAMVSSRRTFLLASSLLTTFTGLRDRHVHLLRRRDLLRAWPSLGLDHASRDGDVPEMALRTFSMCHVCSEPGQDLRRILPHEVGTSKELEVVPVE